MAETVRAEILRQAELLPKKNIVQKSLENYGTIILAEDMQEAVRISNMIAPEHLEICVRDAEKVLPEIRNAGSIFLGEYSQEPLGCLLYTSRCV